MFSSRLHPSCIARSVIHVPGHVCTILRTVGSGLTSTSATASLPPTCSRASRISCVVTAMPGRAHVRVHDGYLLPSTSMRWTKLDTTVAGEQTKTLKSKGTGQTDFSPFRGSRTIPLAYEDNAVLGAPGRTMIVGSRTVRASIHPRRDHS